MKTTKKNNKWILFMLVSVLIATGVVLVLSYGSIFPDTRETDTYGHLFKINFLYNSIKDGNVYPIYTPYWYNSIELFRYWPPLSYYVVAILQFITNGDVIWAFYLFVGVAYVINMFGWYLFGVSENRIVVSFVVGNLFFFCPDNIRILMSEGNIPRIFIGVLVPYAFYFVWRILEYREYHKLIWLSAITVLITFTHFMIAAMLGISIFLFSVLYGISHKIWREVAYITIDLGFAYVMTGIALLPGITGGGLTSQSSEASIATVSVWAQEAIKSLNPFYRFDLSKSSFYFGIVIFIVCCIGLFLADSKTGPGFWATILIFVCTTEAVSEIIKLIPLSQVLWMQRFVPMAMCTFFISMLLWKRLKMHVFILMSILLAVDSITTAAILMDVRLNEVEEIAVEQMQDYLLEDAANQTKNRLGLWDHSKLGAIPSWYLSKDMDANSTLYNYGWAFQGAKTMGNIVSVNEALEKGYYEYSFDRMLEMGSDTIVVVKEWMLKDSEDLLFAAAEKVGYQLWKENDNSWVFVYPNITGTFGVVKKYKNLAIGDQAEFIGYIYPQFGHGHSEYLDDYTFEELTGYKKLYLSGFKYHDKAKAEKLLQEVARAGTLVFVDMQHIPLDKTSGKAEFMDAYAQVVSFTEKFPVLSASDGIEFKLEKHTVDYEVWNTVYVSGISSHLKEAYYDETTDLTYLAQNGYENIYFLGLNLIYYYWESDIPQLLNLLNEILLEEPGEVCPVTICPINIEYGTNQIVVTSSMDEVNTGIADLDCFSLKNAEKRIQHNLLVVNTGRTVYNVIYTHLGPGLLMSLCGLGLSIWFWLFIFKRKNLRK